MKVGSSVFARYPRRDGEGMGIVLKFVKGGMHHWGLIPDKAEVYWASTGRAFWYKCWDLEVINEGR